jgi:hypothetical protein
MEHPAEPARITFWHRFLRHSSMMTIMTIMTFRSKES